MAIRDTWASLPDALGWDHHGSWHTMDGKRVARRGAYVLTVVKATDGAPARWWVHRCTGAEVAAGNCGNVMTGRRAAWDAAGALEVSG